MIFGFCLLEETLKIVMTILWKSDIPVSIVTGKLC